MKRSAYVKAHIISLGVEIMAIVMADKLITNGLAKTAAIMMLAFMAVVNHLLGILFVERTLVD
jgi:hypothetical protein